MIYDVIIIGAGLVGGAVARELSRNKLSVLCLEKEADVCCGTSKANTGIIHTPALIPPGSLKAELAVRGAAAFGRLSTELGFGYQQTGALVAAFCEDDAKVLSKYIAAGRENCSRAGAEPPQYRIIAGSELRELEPELNPGIRSALFAPDAGRVIPYEYGTALWENAVENGIELKLGATVEAVTRIGSDAGELWMVKTRQTAFLSRFIVNAAGHGSNELGMSAGFTDGNIKRVKGQYLILEREKAPDIRRIIFQVPQKGREKDGKGILVTKTVYGNIMIGPDAREQNDHADTSTDLEALDRIVEGGRLSVPGLDPSRCIKTFAGVRPKPAGGDFIIESERNFVHLCGIESPGLTASPAIAETVVKKLELMGLELVKRTDFKPERRPIVEGPSGLSPGELKRRIELPAGDPERLVCRCEQVPESRIADALGRGLPVVTLDGVKRRTRAGQGRCQGDFCGSRVRELISRKMKLPEGQISQRGGEPRLERVTAAEVRARYRKQP